MRTRNPILTRTEGFGSSGGDPAFPAGATMTLDDVVMRTAALFAVLVPAAGAAFVFRPSLLVLAGALAAALIVGLLVAVTDTARPAPMFLYAVAEGVVVGAVSAMYADRFGGNVVPQAVLATLCAFAAMLALYRSGWVRATPGFRRWLLITSAGYFLFGCVHLVGVMCGWWDNVYVGEGANALGVLASVVGTGVATAYLVLDFSAIEDGIAAGLPRKRAWAAAFGLVVTLVWMYLEFLRLVAIFSSSDD